MLKDNYGKDLSAIKQKKLFLLDMDGTLYLGEQLFEGAREILKALKDKGASYVFVTNNSSRSVKAYLEKLDRIGLKGEKKESFYTSTEALVSCLKASFTDPLVYAQGTKAFTTELARHFRVTEEFNREANVIAVGFDTELTFEKMQNTCRMIDTGIPYYATNPDWVCPTENGFVPDCGSMCYSYEKATGRAPIFIGKPRPLMIEAVLGKFGINKDDAVIIGDRLYTDILSGINAGVDTICVLSGESSAEDVESSENKPTYTINHIKDLLKILT